MMILFRARRFLVSAIVCLGMGGAIFAGIDPTRAATERDVRTERKEFSIESPITSPLIKRMQIALKEAGFYKGPINGSINSETEAAILAYQRRENMVLDGIVTEQLVNHLESSIKVRSLLQQLQDQRIVNIEAARKALMQSPETRRLLSGSREADSVADPTRDSAPCLAKPNPECLLAEASASARAVFKDELRYWALSEILVAEAKAGLVEKAMNTISRIDDPRLMIVALRDIAEAQARSGRPAEALAAVDIIPDVIKRAEALAAIGSIQVQTPKTGIVQTRANKTVDKLFAALTKIDDPLKQISLQAQGAIILHQDGDTKTADLTLSKALTNANKLLDQKSRSVALRHVANALSEIDHPRQALAILDNVPEPAEHTPVLISAAAAHARAGQADLALATAETIQIVRYRVVVLGRIAVALANAGDMIAANTVLEKAFQEIEQIELPFAQSYAHERMAQALISVARLQEPRIVKATYERAITSARRIGDNMLRARTLWAVTNAQRDTGDRQAAAKTEVLAETATKTIRSVLTKVWMFCTIAIDHRTAGEINDSSWAFQRALNLTKDITNPWSRARALARLASTLVDLSAGN